MEVSLAHARIAGCQHLLQCNCMLYDFNSFRGWSLCHALVWGCSLVCALLCLTNMVKLQLLRVVVVFLFSAFWQAYMHKNACIPSSA